MTPIHYSPLEEGGGHSKKQLICGTCGKPAQEGKAAGAHCGQFFDEVNRGMFCSGTIIELEQDFELFDQVVHPDIYWGREVFTVVGIRLEELELQGDWSGGTHNISQRGWHKRKGTVLHARPRYTQSLQNQQP